MRCCAPDPAGGANSGPTELLTGFFARGKDGVRGERKEKEVKGENDGRKEGDKGKGGWRNGKRGILCICFHSVFELTNFSP